MIIYNDKQLTELMIKKDIPLELKNMIAVQNITTKTCITEEIFDEIIKYLKERSKRDIYGKYPEEKNFDKEQIIDWTFYLKEYSYYITNILKPEHWLDTKKYLFPDDIYDITYHYNKDVMAFKYLEEHFKLTSD